MSAKQHCCDNFGHEFDWQINIDVDEFPFAPDDTKPGFLLRTLAKLRSMYPEGTEFLMANYLQLGYRRRERGPMILQQVDRVTLEPANNLVKPIVQCSAIDNAGVHRNRLRTGVSVEAPAHILHQRHTFAARLQQWRKEMPAELESTTREDVDLLPIADALMDCL